MREFLHDKRLPHNCADTRAPYARERKFTSCVFDLGELNARLLRDYRDDDR
jgi:hypothetical protein